MAVYRYSARTARGETTGGTIEASDQRDAVRLLHARGLIVTQLAEQYAAPARPARGRLQPAVLGDFRSVPRLWASGLQPGAGRVGLRDLAVFCRQFATMVGAGVHVLRALDILARQASSRRLRWALGEVRAAVEQGRSLPEAFGARPDVFPIMLTNMVAAGDTAGVLPECLDRLAEYFEKEHAVSQKVRTALTYPVVVTGVAAAVLVLMIVFVLPTFASIFGQIGAELPTPTRIALELSDFLRKQWYLVAGGLGAAVLAFRLYARTTGGAYAIDSLALRIPVIGDLVRKRAISRFARTLGTLEKHGVHLLVALPVVERTVGSRPVAAALRQAEEEIKAGRPLAEPLRSSRMFPQMVVEMITVGDETGKVDEMLMKAADFYEKEIDASVSQISAMIEPIILVGLGVVVGFILVSVMMPLFDVYRQIKI